jgi:transposase
MEVLYPRCAGLDVHKDSVVAHVRCVSAPRVSETRTFRTTTAALIELQEWLSTQAVTHVGMEATGIYWKPVWHLLEGYFELVLANAQHVRNVPGRKTDVSDAVWLAELLAHGLISASFVPPVPIQELRDLTRTRKQLVREISQHAARIQKVLEDANLKLGSVLTDVLGKSGRAILQALIDGQTDPDTLADLAQGNARKKRNELRQALQGRIREHHRRLLKVHLQLINSLQTAVAEIEAAVGKSLAPIQHSARLLTTMPGMSDVTAHVVVAEIGVDMSRFASSAHLLSWATFCPRNDQSAGKRRSTRMRKGGTWLKTTMVSAAWAAVRVKGGYLYGQFLRLKARRGAKKAIIAVAASMLTAAYHMLKNGTEYHDLGAEHFTQRDRSKLITRLLRRLTDLGCDVQVTEQQA